MKPGWVRALAVGLMLVGGPALAGRYAILVGNNTGSGVEMPLRFAERDAERLQGVLRELGGFTPEHVALLRSPGARSLEAAFDSVAEQIRTSGDKGALLLFFYSGHADGSSLHLGADSLTLEHLRLLIARSGAAVRVGVLDACGTGAMTSREKGLKTTEPFLLSVPSELSTRGQVIIAAVSDTELAQESDALQGSFFSTYLVSALRGAADRANTGRVTLNDAYRYTYDQTVRATLLSRTGAQHPSYAVDLSGQGDLVLTEPKKGRAKLAFRSDGAGEFVVFAPGETLVAQIFIERDSEAVLALEPGDYEIQKRTGGGLRFARVQVNAGEERELREARMQTLQYVPLAKKGVGLRAVAELGGVSGQTAIVWGGPLLRLGVEADLGHSLLSPRLTFAYAKDYWVEYGPLGIPVKDVPFAIDNFSTPATEAELGLGASWTRPWEWTHGELRAGAAADVMFHEQSVYNTSHLSTSLNVAAVAAAAFRLGRSGVLLGVQVEPGAMFTMEAGRPRLHGFLLATFGVHYEF